MGAFALACLWSAGAVLTRQSFLWVALGGRVLSPARWSRTARLRGRRPAGPRARTARGARHRMERPRPAGGGPLSCGLCTDARASAATCSRCEQSASRWRCSAPTRWWCSGRAAARRARAVTVPRSARPIAARRRRGAAPDLAARIHPDRPRPAGRRGLPVALSELLPTLLGSSLLFWVLVPLGAAAAALLVWRPGRARCRASTWAASCSRRSPWGSSTRSTSTRSCCSPWPCLRGAPTSQPRRLRRRGACLLGLRGLCAELR